MSHINTLLVIPCSKKKSLKASGEVSVDQEQSYVDVLSPKLRQRVTEARTALSQLHGVAQAEPLAAVERYAGRLYQAQLPKILSELYQGQGEGPQTHVMIISALYGPLHPFEHIDSYELNMSQSLRVWRPLMRDILAELCTHLHISRIELFLGSSTSYLKAMSTALDELLMRGILSDVYQYHITNGGSAKTPLTHGRLLLERLDGPRMNVLQGQVVIRRGDQLGEERPYECGFWRDESSSVHPHSALSHEEQRISHCTRSSFLTALIDALTLERSPLMSGVQVSVTLESGGGYSGREVIVIDKGDVDTFGCVGFTRDPSRFPARLKAAAKALHTLKLFGRFEVTHHDGTLTVQAIDLVMPTQVISAVSVRDRGWREEQLLNKPAVYQWWFPESVAAQLNVPIEGCERRIGGEVLLYVGIAKSLRERLEWHVCQKHNPSAIKSGYISTLRFTLVALMRHTLLQESELNTLIDQLSISYVYCASRDEALRAESALMKTRSLPLNIQGNQHGFKRELMSLRSQCKRRSLTLLEASEI